MQTDVDQQLLEIKHYYGEGYRPLIDFGSWRVAILHWEKSMEPENVKRMERHTQTDEVFVLLCGEATLILGGNSGHVGQIDHQKLEFGNLYNVKQNAWHAVVLSRGASILIVEENNTGEVNTEYCELASDLQTRIANLTGGR